MPGMEFPSICAETAPEPVIQRIKMQSGKTNREALLLELKAQDADPLNSPLLNVSTIARGELREQDTELLEALPLIWERSDRLDTLEIDVGNATALAVDYLVHLRQLPVWTLRNLRIVGPRNGPDRRPYFAPRNEYSNSSGSIVSKLRSLTFLHSSKASMKTRTRLSGL